MIVVTGGSGFVGSHIVEHLARRGGQVLAVDLHEPTEPVKSLWKPYEGQIRFERANILDRQTMDSLFYEYPPEAVVHAATITNAAECEWEEPERMLQIGIVGSAVVMSAAHRHRVGRFLYISSASIYEPVPNSACVLGEDDRLQQYGLYPLTKAAGEWLTRQLTAGGAGMEAASVRIAACYGPLEANTGARTSMSHVCNAVRRAQEGKPLLVGSPDYVLDYTYVKDIAEGVVQVLLARQWKHAAYNISGGRGYTLLEVANAVAAIMPGTEVRVTEHLSEGVLFAKKGSRTGILNIARLRSETPYVPAYDLQSGLADYMKWLAVHEY